MKYKESTRSPGYGKVFMKDLNGRITEELDLLRVIVVDGKNDYTIREILEMALGNAESMQEIDELKRKVKFQDEQLKLIKQLLVLQEAKIEALNLN